MSQNNSSYHRIKNCFIANRAEIARRICCCLGKLGISSTCVCSSSEASFMSEFATSLIVTENTGSDFYLDGSSLIKLALQHGCDSLHPGYGFLSEDPSFAAQVIESGLCWIGPSPEAMRLLSSKSSSTGLARKLGIPCSNSVLISEERLLDNPDWESIKKKLSSFSYPLLIKGARAGGGKGMRVCESPEELSGCIQKTATDCKKYFGSSDLIIEEFHGDARHIEVQLVADKFSNVFTLGTRDCSIQRRNQKIIETAPADIPEGVRTKLTDYARTIIKESGYDSMATVEFLVDSKNKVYFLEVNTRIQVEHPVTEILYGMDLVELQLKIASGINLSETEYLSELQKIDSNPSETQGSSMELRICAEDPMSLFPVSGKVLLSPDQADKDTRWDLGIKTNREIEVSSSFDSLLAKCIVKGKDRSECIFKLQKVLKYTLVTGITNIALFRKILKDPDFIENRINTRYLETHLASFYPSEYFSGFDSRKFLSIRNLIPGYFSKLGRGSVADDLVVEPNSNKDTKIVKKKTPVNKLNKNNGYSYNNSSSIKGDSTTSEFSSRLSSLSKYRIYPKVPAKVTSLLKGVGDLVSPGETIFILESMKMEIEVKSEVTGRIVSVSSNSWVNTTDLLAELEPITSN